MSLSRPRRTPASRISSPGRRNRHHPILGKVFAALGYLGQIMLQAMPQVAREIDLGFSSNTWIELVNESGYPQASRAGHPIHIQTPDEVAAKPAPAPNQHPRS